MKPTEFKKLIKPLIKQTVKEVLFEEGVLSGIVSEVAKGLSNQRLFVEGATIKQEEDLEAKAARMEEQRQQKVDKLRKRVATTNILNIPK